MGKGQSLNDIDRFNWFVNLNHLAKVRLYYNSSTARIYECT